MSGPPPRAPTFPAFIDELPQRTARNAPSPLHRPSSLSPPMDPPPSSTLSAGTVHSVPSSQTSSSSNPVPVVPLHVAQRSSVIADVLLWRKPKVTALYFGAALLFFYFTLVRCLSVLSVLGSLLALYQCLGLALVTANKHVTSQLDSYIARPPSGTPLFRQDVANRWATTIVDEGNDVQHFLRDVMYCDAPPVTFACFLFGLFFYWIGHYVSIVSVMLVITLLLFTVPVAYQHNKKQVDQVLARASDTLSKGVITGQKFVGEKTVDILDKAPPAARDLAVRVGLTPKKKRS